MKTTFVGILKLVVLGLFLVNVSTALAQEQNNQGASAQEQTQTVNINTADLEELMSLPRVGPVIAQRIIDFRTEHGEFKAVEEIMNVKGIGEKTFEKLKPLIRI